MISVQLNHSSPGGDEKCQLDYVNANFELNSLWFLLPLLVWLTVFLYYLRFLDNDNVSRITLLGIFQNIGRPEDVTN